MGSTWNFFVTDDTSTTVRQLSGNVTIHALAAETAIRSRLQAIGAQQNQFLPEADIVDEQTVRADYEKLRVLFELNKAIGAERDQVEILDRILDKAFEFSGADRGVIPPERRG